MADGDASDKIASATEADDSAVALTYADRLPVAWEPVAEPMDDTFHARLNHDNLQVLQAVGALEENVAEPDEDEDGATAQALARLDRKVNLLLELVGKLVVENGDLPAAVPMQLGSDRLIWSGSALSLERGDTGVAAVYLRASPATPLRLAGRVEGVLGQGDESRYELAYLNLHEPVRNALERLIFRHHRRLIASRHPHTA